MRIRRWAVGGGTFGALAAALLIAGCGSSHINEMMDHAAASPESHGYTRWRDRWHGRLEDDSVHSIRVDMQGAVAYMVVGVCEGCERLRMVVRPATNFQGVVRAILDVAQAVAYTTEANTTGALDLIAPHTGRYDILVQMNGCRGAPGVGAGCTWAINVFERRIGSP